MKTQDQATSRPWKHEEVRNKPLGNGNWITDGKLLKIANIQTWGDKPSSKVREESLANAKLIVRAVNSHEHLISILSLIISDYEAANQIHPYRIKEAKEAIAKAEA